VLWLLRRRSSRFQMDGLVFGAAAGMGFAAFETIVYGIRSVDVLPAMISTLSLRALLAPFGHGTWSALVCGALWRGKTGSHRLFSWDVLGTFLAAVGLHALWDWQPLPGSLDLTWFLFIGVAGIDLLRRAVLRARGEEMSALVSLNPELASA